MKRIGVVGDTHGPLPEAVFRLFNGEWTESDLMEAACGQVACAYDGAVLTITRNEPPCAIGAQHCDLILHAGDIGPQMTLDELGTITRTAAVLGNNDFDDFFCSDGRVNPMRRLNFEGVDIAMAHIPRDLQRALRDGAPTQGEPDLAVHGHTHTPLIEQTGNHVTLCPGSPSRARAGCGHTVALVDVENGRMRTITLVNV